MIYLRTTTSVIVCILAAAALSAAQSGDGSLRGTVKDPQGLVLPGVTVTASAPSLIKPAIAVTDNTGYYRIINLPPGEYMLTAELPGFAKYEQAGIQLRAGANYTIDIQMRLGGLSEVVTVTGQAAMLETTQASNILNISGEFQREMPLQARRNWSDFLELTPGVHSRPFDDGSGRMVYFGHATEHFAHVTQLEGLSAANYQDTQLTYIGMGADMIQDVQIKTGGVDASAPMGTGLVINVVTKSGGDEFHGSVAYAYQPYKWNGNNARTSGNFSGTPTISEIKQFDAGIGGPIKRGRVWFFGSLRRADLGSGISRTPREVENLRTFFPGIDLFNNTTDSWLPYVKVTTRLTDRHELSAYYQYDRLLATGDREYHFSPSVVYSTGGSLFGAKLTSAWSPKLTSTFLVSYNNKGGSDEKTFAGREGKGPYIVIHKSAYASGGRAVGTGSLVEGGNFNGGSYSLLPASQWTIRGDLTWYKSNFGGSHEFQTGIFIAPRSTYDTETRYVNNGFYLEERQQVDPDNPAAGLVPFHRAYADPIRLHTRAARDRNIGFYVQDSWRPVTRLTLNIGVRFDYVRRYDKIFDIVRQSSWQVGPRFGFAYMLTKDAGTVLRGSIIRVHEQMMGRDAVTTFGATSRVSIRDEYDLAGTGNWTSIVSPAVTASLSTQEFDPDLHQPFVDEIILGIRRQLPGGIALDVAGIQRVYKETYALVDINGLWPDGPYKPFGGFGKVDPNRGLFYRQTNNTWSTLNYRAVEITATRNMAHGFAILAGINRQWQFYRGFWNPTDPARFIQPDAFPNNKLLYMPRGNNEHNSLRLTTGGTWLTYGPTWQKYRGSVAGTWQAPLKIVVSSSLTLQAGPWSGPIVDLLPAGDPQLAVFGPATFTLPNGTKQSNPLSTRLRYVYRTRGEGQVQAPAITTLGLKIGRKFGFWSEKCQLELAGNIFNLLNAGNFMQYNYQGASERFNPNFLQMRNQQAARALQMTAVFRF